MSQEQSRTLKEVMGSLDGVELKEKRGGSFRFQMKLTRQMKETSIDVLDLSVRSYHALKRAGYDRIGELAADIAGGKELKNIRNCGAKSVREIMERLFLFQYHSLSPERRDTYLREVVVLNIK